MDSGEVAPPPTASSISLNARSADLLLDDAPRCRAAAAAADSGTDPAFCPPAGRLMPAAFESQSDSGCLR